MEVGAQTLRPFTEILAKYFISLQTFQKDNQMNLLELETVRNGTRQQACVLTEQTKVRKGKNSAKRVIRRKPHI